jgi:hypothetical protein
VIRKVRSGAAVTDSAAALCGDFAAQSGHWPCRAATFVRTIWLEKVHFRRSLRTKMADSCIALRSVPPFGGERTGTAANSGITWR